MEYTEEEKKAIDYLENLDIDFNTLSRINLRDLDNCKKVILNLIEKQQKEIEELNNKYNFEKVAKEEVEELLDDSIPKEAIREKMKQLEITECTIRYDKYDIQDILKELLGE